MGSVLYIYHSSEKSDINEKKLHFKLLILKDKFMVKNADFVFSFNRLQARRFAKGYVLLYTLRNKSIGRITGTEITGTEITGTARLGL